jgi:hypothetical protein
MASPIPAAFKAKLMILAYDVFADTNPAFCAAVLACFCDAHIGFNGLRPTLPVAYLVLPIVLSEELAASFEKSNKKTGLLVWLERSPGVLDGLSNRVNSTLQITTDAVRFGCISGILHLGDDGCLISTGIKNPSPAITSSVSNAFKRARLLGSWFASAGSARTIMEAMVVSV